MLNVERGGTLTKPLCFELLMLFAWNPSNVFTGFTEAPWIINLIAKWKSAVTPDTVRNSDTQKQPQLAYHLNGQQISRRVCFLFWSPSFYNWNVRRSRSKILTNISLILAHFTYLTSYILKFRPYNIKIQLWLRREHTAYNLNMCTVSSVIMCTVLWANVRWILLRMIQRYRLLSTSCLCLHACVFRLIIV